MEIIQTANKSVWITKYKRSVVLRRKKEWNELHLIQRRKVLSSSLNKTKSTKAKTVQVKKQQQQQNKKASNNPLKQRIYRNG